MTNCKRLMVRITKLCKKLYDEYARLAEEHGSGNYTGIDIYREGLIITIRKDEKKVWEKQRDLIQKMKEELGEEEAKKRIHKSLCKNFFGDENFLDQFEDPTDPASGMTEEEKGPELDDYYVRSEFHSNDRLKEVLGLSNKERNKDDRESN